MDKERVDFFRTLLQEHLAALFAQAGGTVSDLLNGETHFPDLLDQATLESHHSTLLRIRDRESRLIPKIQNALKRLEDGTFGICDACGRDIGDARLMARPVATLCIRCKTKMEAREKMYG